MEWASWVAGAFDKLIARFDEQDANFANLIDLWQYLRREGAPVGQEVTIERVFLNTTKTTTSTTIVDVADSSYVHTLTKQNFEAECHNITANNSSGSFDTTFQIAVPGITVIDAAVATVRGAVDVGLSCAIRGFEATPGTPRTFKLQWKVGGGTGSIFVASSLLWIIREWD